MRTARGERFTIRQRNLPKRESSNRCQERPRHTAQARSSKSSTAQDKNRDDAKRVKMLTALDMRSKGIFRREGELSSLNQIMEALPLTIPHRGHQMASGNRVPQTGGEGIFQEAVGNHQEVVTMINASHINMMTTGHQETIQVADLKWTTGGHQWTRGGLL